MKKFLFTISIRPAFKEVTVKKYLFFLSIFLLSVFSLNKGLAQSQGMAKLSIHLLLNTNAGSSNTADGCMVLYANSFTTGLGPEDSYKFTNLDENLALPCGNSMLSVEGRPTIANNDTIPLKIWQYRQNNYYLQFEATNFSPNLAAVLKDNYLQQDQLIGIAGITTINYTLTADSASAAADRFCVVFKPANTLPLSLLNFSALQKEDGISIEWTMGNEVGVIRYEIEKSADAVTFTGVGTVAVSTAAGSNSHHWLDKEIINGITYYRIKMTGKGGDVQVSKIIKLVANTKTQRINVYPNPIKGNTIGLQLFDIEKGVYQMKLYNGAGQQVYTRTLIHEGGSATQSFTITSSLYKGGYTLMLTSGQNVYNRHVIID